MKFLVVVRVVVIIVMVIAREILNQPPDGPVMAFFKDLGHQLAAVISSTLHPPNDLVTP